MTSESNTYHAFPLHIPFLELLLGFTSEVVCDDAADGSLRAVWSSVGQICVAVSTKATLVSFSEGNANVVAAAELGKVLNKRTGVIQETFYSQPGLLLQ